MLPKGGQHTAVVWERDRTIRTLPTGTEGLLINRDGLVVGSHADPNLSHGVWRANTLEYTFGTLSDGNTFAGQLRATPTVWRCT